MNAPVRIIPASTTTIKAWRVPCQEQGNPRFEAFQVDLPEWVETADHAAMAGLRHDNKHSIMVLVSDAAQRPERRHVLHVYASRKRTRRNYIRLPDGTTGREPEFYPALVMQVCVHEGFAPVEPWRWTPDADVTGCDRTLVEEATR